MDPHTMSRIGTMRLDSGDSSAKVEEAYDLCQEMEHNMRILLPQKGPMDYAVAILRSRLRETYVNVIFGNYEYAYIRDVEKRLWKFGFYKYIEEFRRRIRRTVCSLPYMGIIQLASKPIRSRPSRQEGPDESDADLALHVRALQGFLNEASGFYHNLSLRLQLHFDVHLPGILHYDTMGLAVESKGLENVVENKMSGVQSIHRCLIYLGDVARYREMYTDNPRKDFTLARQYYYQALQLLPGNGNPYNQLAVLSAYCNDDLTTTYYYLRSLMLDEPFLPAQDNLTMLYERIGKTRTDEPLVIKAGDSKDKTGCAIKFTSAYLRIHQLISTNEKTDEVEGLTVIVLRETKELLKLKYFSDTSMLRIMALNILLAHRCFSDTSINMVVQHHVITLVFRFLASVLDTCVRITDNAARKIKKCKDKLVSNSKAPVPFLGSIKVFCDWLRINQLVWNNSNIMAVIIGSRIGPYMATLFNNLPIVLYMNDFTYPTDPNDWPNTPALSEDLELKRFTPLHHVNYNFKLYDGPPSDLSNIRAISLLKFGVWLGSIAPLSPILCNCNSRFPVFSDNPVANASIARNRDNEIDSQGQWTNSMKGSKGEPAEISDLIGGQKEQTSRIQKSSNEISEDDEMIVYAVTGDSPGPIDKSTPPSSKCHKPPLICNEPPLPSPLLSGPFTPIPFVPAIFGMASASPRSESTSHMSDSSQQEAILSTSATVIGQGVWGVPAAPRGTLFKNATIKANHYEPTPSEALKNSNVNLHKPPLSDGGISSTPPGHTFSETAMPIQRHGSLFSAQDDVKHPTTSQSPPLPFSLWGETNQRSPALLGMSPMTPRQPHLGQSPIPPTHGLSGIKPGIEEEEFPPLSSTPTNKITSNFIHHQSYHNTTNGSTDPVGY